eukprot:4052062-Amphidinium_carterae.2
MDFDEAPEYAQGLELARRTIERSQEVTDATDNEVNATLGGQRMPSVPPPRDAEMEELGSGDEVDATVG